MAAATPRARVFYALPVEEDLRDELAALARDVAQTCRGRAMPAANLHATLAFLGDVHREVLPRLEVLGAATTRSPLELSLDRVGSFPRAGVAYVAASHVPAALLDLHAQLAQALTAERFRLDARPYRPHVTLARHCGQPLRDQAVPGRAWRPRCLALYESVTAPEGAQYQVIASWTL